MRKVMTIAAREYNAAVRSKSFLISLLMLPVFFGGGIVIQLLFRDKVDTAERTFAVVDRSPGGELAQALKAALETRNATAIIDSTTQKQTQPKFNLEVTPPSANDSTAKDEQRFELSERVRKGELFGFLEIGGQVNELDPKIDPNDPEAIALRYQSNSPTYNLFSRWAENVLNESIRRKRYEQSGLSPDVVGKVMAPVPMVAKRLNERDLATGKVQEAKQENVLANILAPGGLMILMFMIILVGSTPLMQGVVEEKMQKIAEVLLGSVRPFELMMGKLLGMVGVSLTLSIVYLGGAYITAHYYDYTQFLPVSLLLWFVLFQILGVVLFGSIFIAVGAACTDIRETQNMIGPVMMVVVVPMFIWINVVQSPNSTFSTVASFVPTATPMLMVLRLAVPPGPPWWQPPLGVLGVLATTVACVYAAGRIFRVGILMQGKGASFRDLARWVFMG